MNLFPAVRFLLSVAHVEQFPADTGREIAMAGRSNAGKSTALNVLTARKSLARVSKTPGRTRLLNYFELAPDQRIVDLPGYGYATVTNEERGMWLPLLNALQRRQALRGLVLIVDSRRGVAEQDLALIDWADPTLRRVHVLLAKTDKLKRNEMAAALKTARAALDPRVTVQAFSAHDGTGVTEAQQVLRQLLLAAQRTPDPVSVPQK